MNRQQRRRLMREAKKANKISPLKRRVIAFHEAGHAVARYLTKEDMGYSLKECITRIEIPKEPKMELLSEHGVHITEATTYGPRFSREIANFCPVDKFSEAEAFGFVDKARSQGADIEKWIQSMAVIAVMGPLCEAALIGENDIPAVLQKCGSNDLALLADEIHWAGITNQRTQNAIVNKAIAKGQQYLSMVQVVNAVNNLADFLYDNSYTDGRLAAQIIDKSMKDPANDNEIISELAS